MGGTGGCIPGRLEKYRLPHPEESTPYTVFIMEHMMEIAGYLGKQQDKALFEKYRDGCTKAYRELVTLPGYTLDTNR